MSLVARALVVLGLATALSGCERYETLTVLPPGSLKTHYLIDFTYVNDPATHAATEGHLVVFNPSETAADLDVTIFYQDREPEHLRRRAEPGASTEEGFKSWPVKPGERFALAVTSSLPVVAQATLGWNNVGNDDAPTARAQGGGRPRETVTSYLSIPTLAERWYLADGIVIDSPKNLWIRESERAVILNPGDTAAHVDLALFFKVFTRNHMVEVPPRRVRAFLMDDLVTLRNKHYGVRFASDVPIAAQWRRTVEWYDFPELMGFWSVPCLPLTPTADPVQ